MFSSRLAQIVIIALISSTGTLPAQEDTRKIKFDEIEKKLNGIWKSDVDATEKYILEMKNNKNFGELTRESDDERVFAFKDGEMVEIEYDTNKEIKLPLNKYFVTIDRTGASYLVIHSTHLGNAGACIRIVFHKEFLVFAPMIGAKNGEVTVFKNISQEKLKRHVAHVKKMLNTRPEGFAYVEGIITMDGKALAEATISMSNNVSVSTATSDDKGQFKMQFAHGPRAYDGAPIGNLKVAVRKVEEQEPINIPEPSEDASDEEIEAYQEAMFKAEEEREEPKSLIPIKYNNPQESGLTVEVSNAGIKDLKLILESK